MIECPAGRYGDSEGLENSFCTGKCSAGYFCPKGSKSGTAKPCGVDKAPPQAKWYCESESSSPVEASQGYYTTAIDPSSGKRLAANPVLIRATKNMCPSFAFHCTGDGEKVLTKAGTYSTGCNADGEGCLNFAECPVGFFCDGGVKTQCSVGEHCPAGSKSNINDGTDNCRLSAYYCKNNIIANTSEGYYSIPFDEIYSTPYTEQCRCDQTRIPATSTAPEICGATETNPHSFYCPWTSDLETRGTREPVYDGWYSTPEDPTKLRTGIQRCDSPTHFCAQGVRIATPPGHYALVDGTTNLYVGSLPCPMF